MKRVLYIAQYYVTGDQIGGMRHHQHIRVLTRLGYQVTLVTCYVDNYLRTIPLEYQDRKIWREQDGNLTIFRTYAYPNYGADFRTRMLNYLTFMFYAIIAGVKSGPCDLVFASSPPLFVGLAGYVLSRWKRVPFVFEVRDLWPEAAVVMGALRSPVLLKLATWLAQVLYRHAKRIIAVTEGIKQGIISTGISDSKVELVPNGVDDDLFSSLPSETATQIRQEYGWGDRFVALYAGGLARSDGLPAIVRAAAALAEDERFLVVFLGDGEVKPYLMELTEELRLSNVMFIAAVPRRRVPDFIAAADVCLMPVQRGDFFHMHLPNKIFDYMAGARTVIAAVPPGEAQAMVECAEAGVVIAPEDAASLVTALLTLHDVPEDRQRYGQNGRRYVLAHYLRSDLGARLASVLDSVSLENGEIAARKVAD